MSSYEHSIYWYAKRYAQDGRPVPAYAIPSPSRAGDYYSRLVDYSSCHAKPGRKRKKVYLTAAVKKEIEHEEKILARCDAARKVHEFIVDGLPSGYRNGCDLITLGLMASAYIGVAMYQVISELPVGKERQTLKETLLRHFRKVNRSKYYEYETKRRQLLAIERRKIKLRRTSAHEPTPEEVLDAWKHRKESKAKMIILGGMLQDLECFVDRRLMVDESGRITRKSGIRGWIRFHLPDLAPHYKTLMRYKAMAVKLRQATETKDPKPTGELLEGEPHEVVAEIFSSGGETFTSIMKVLDKYLSPNQVPTDFHPD